MIADATQLCGPRRSPEWRLASNTERCFNADAAAGDIQADPAYSTSPTPIPARSDDTVESLNTAGTRADGAGSTQAAVPATPIAVPVSDPTAVFAGVPVAVTPASGAASAGAAAAGSSRRRPREGDECEDASAQRPKRRPRISWNPCLQECRPEVCDGCADASEGKGLAETLASLPHCVGSIPPLSLEGGSLLDSLLGRKARGAGPGLSLESLNSLEAAIASANQSAEAAAAFADRLSSG